MLANRLRKNLARLEPWARREGLEAWRLYDRDIPEIPWSVDLYAGNALLTEHVTPVGLRHSVEKHAAELAGVHDAAASALGLPPERIFTRTRARHRSFEREAEGSAVHEIPVRERELQFLVNLSDYLDTGLFLDHREARRRIGAASTGRRVLNLFCYTGAFTAYAAQGGASRTVSVDLSATYLAWAERNLRLNALQGRAHELVRADVFEWLTANRDVFDLIVLDPPTVSRAARGRSFDVQSAHAGLIRLALQRLAAGGTLLFSTNHRAFRFEPGKLARVEVREITAETQSRDFREQLHRSWELKSVA
jgi:23S rRNA (guanine2445-N2)-methyltransferase / 23S rRNA (guanine2069-N7)-methyltransferase